MEVFGVLNPHLFPNREDVTLGNFPGFSGPCQLQPDTQESGAMSFDSQGKSKILFFVESNILGYGLLKKKLGRTNELNFMNLD